MKNIGAVNALYPTPVTIVGTVVDGKVNWINIAHVGIMGMDKITLSMSSRHYSNKGIIENKAASIHLITEDMLIPADYVGIASGNSVDKSEVFEYEMGQLKGVPIIKNAPVCMECELIDVYHSDDTHDDFVLKIVNTYVNEKYLNEKGKIDYSKFKPVLFEMSDRAYMTTGEKVETCWDIGNKYDEIGRSE